MTSTNDGKDVKSNPTSSQKGKTYYIELYKSLDTRLNSDHSLHERTQNLCQAWCLVHSLCQHSAPSTHSHLLTWLQRHTAKTVLQTEWQSPSSKDEHTALLEAITVFVQQCSHAAACRKGPTPAWETQLLQRADWFTRVLENPWGHPVLRVLLDPRETQPSDDEIVEWLKEERGVMFVTRLRQLVSSKCNDLAATLATAVMSRARACHRVLADDEHTDEQSKDPTLEQDLNFESTLTNSAGFTADVWELLTDIEFVLLHKADKHLQCIELAKQTPLRNGYQLVERLLTRLKASPKEKKLWKNAKDVAVLIAQVIITRCMVVPACAGISRTALYKCARVLARALDGAALHRATATLAAPAATAKHLHTLAAAVHAQSTEDMKPFVCELYVRAITSGMNELEKLKLKTEKASEARSTEQTLSQWFLQLGALLAASARIQCECTLTAFSVHPTQPMYERIKEAPLLTNRVTDALEPKEESTSEFGSWASDSRKQSNFVKTSETLNMKHSQQQANVMSTAVFTEGEALGLTPELCQDIAVLLSGPRVKTLSWDMKRELLLENCRTYMDRTHAGTRALTTELKYLNLDPSAFQHLPAEDDDEENDLYYGIEKGYEHLVELQEAEPEQIWEDAVWDDEETLSAYSSDKESTTTRRKPKVKSQTYFSGDECDPLSIVAEIKRIEKKERTQSKERSQSRERKKKSKDKPTDPNRLKEKKEKKKEKKQRKKKETKGNLSGILGLKVTNVDILTDSVVDRDSASQGQPSIHSEVNAPDAVIDEKLSVVDLKSPARKRMDDVCPVKNTELKTQSPIEIHKPAALKAKNSTNQTPVSSLSALYSVPKPKSLQVVKINVRNTISKLLQFRRQKNNPKNNLNIPNTSRGPTIPKIQNTPSRTAMPQEDIKPTNSLAAYLGSKIERNSDASKVKVNKTDQKRMLTNEINCLLAGNNMNRGIKMYDIPDVENTCSRAFPYNYTKKAQNLTKSITGPTEKIANQIQNIPKPETTQNLIHNLAIQNSTNQTNPSITSIPTNNVLNSARNTVITQPVNSKFQPTYNKPKQGYNKVLQNRIDTHQKSFQEFIKGWQGIGSTESTSLAKVMPVPSNIPMNTTAGVTTNTSKTESVSQSAKPTLAVPQKKVENAPNTFSRLSYMHKNKYSNTKDVDKVANEKLTLENIKLQNSISAELDKRIADLKLCKMMAKGDVSVSRVPHPSVKPQNHKVEVQIVESMNPVNLTTENPTLLSILHGNKNLSRPDPPRIAATSNGTSLSEKDQQDILLLLRQKRKLDGVLDTNTESIIRNADIAPTSMLKSNIIKSAPIGITPIGNIYKTMDPPIQNQIKTFNSYPIFKPTNPKRVNVKSKIIKPTNAIQKLSKNMSLPNSTQNSIPNIAAHETMKQYEAKFTGSNLPAADRFCDSYEKPQDWTKVFDAMRAQKTPRRGPNALDMIMNKDSFDKYADNENRTLTKPIAPTKISEILQAENSNKESPQNLITESSKLKISNNPTVTQQYHNNKVVSSSTPVVLNIPSVKQRIPKSQSLKSSSSTIIQPSNPICNQKDDPFVSGIVNSDYDLLEELIDDDLRKEIGELLSDEEYPNENVNRRPKSTCGRSSQVLTGQQLQITDAFGIQNRKADQRTLISKCKNSITVEKPSESSAFSRPELKITSNERLLYKISDNAASDRNAQFLSKIVPVINTGSTNNFVNNLQPSKSANSSTPNSISNMIVYGQSAYNSYPTIKIPETRTNTCNIHSKDFSMKSDVIFTPEYVTPVNPVVYGTTVVSQLPVNNVSQATIPQQFLSQNEPLNQIDNTQKIPASLSESNPNHDINTALENPKLIIENNTACLETKNHETNYTQLQSNENVLKDINSNKNSERKVLSEVQEKQLAEKIEPYIRNTSFVIDNKEQERLRKKRFAIINREINHKCVHPIISLSYSSLKTPNQLEEINISKNINNVPIELKTLESTSSITSESNIKDVSDKVVNEVSKENNDSASSRRINLPVSKQQKVKPLRMPRKVATKTKPRLKPAAKLKEKNASIKDISSSQDNQVIGGMNPNSTVVGVMTSKRKRVSKRKSTPKNFKTKVDNITVKKAKSAQKVPDEKQKNTTTNNEIGVDSKPALKMIDDLIDIEDILEAKVITNPKRLPETKCNTQKVEANDGGNNAKLGSSQQEVSSTSDQSAIQTVNETRNTEFIQQDQDCDLPKADTAALPIDNKLKDESVSPNKKCTEEQKLTENHTEQKHKMKLLENEIEAAINKLTDSTIGQSKSEPDNVDSNVGIIKVNKRVMESDTNDIKSVCVLDMDVTTSDNESEDISAKLKGAKIITCSNMRTRSNKHAKSKPNSNNAVEQDKHASLLKQLTSTHKEKVDTNLIPNQQLSGCKNIENSDDNVILLENKTIPKTACNIKQSSNDVNMSPKSDKRQTAYTDVNKNDALPPDLLYGIGIEEIACHNNPQQKVVRIRLPNGKIFKVTVSGVLQVGIDTLFQNPEMRNVLLGQNVCKRYNFKIQQHNLKTAPKPSAKIVETVNLLSDDDEEEERVQSLVTEFGSYEVKCTDINDLKKHQEKLFQKCSVKLNRCPSPLSIAKKLNASEVSSEAGDLRIKDEVDSKSKPETTANREIKIIPEVIEIDESSTDSVECFTDLETKKIDVFKDLLLKEFGVAEASNKHLHSTKIEITSAGNDKSEIILDRKTEDPYKRVKPSPTNITQKCFVKLIRCDHLLRKTILTEPSKNIKSDETDEITKKTEDSVSKPVQTKSATLSILNDFETNDVDLSSESEISSSNIDVTETISALMSIPEYDRSSPLMEVFDTIAFLKHNSGIANDSKKITTKSLCIKPDTCMSEWFQTKPSLHLQSRTTTKFKDTVTIHDILTECDSYPDVTSCSTDSGYKESTNVSRISSLCTQMAKYFQNNSLVLHLRPYRDQLTIASPTYKLKRQLQGEYRTSHNKKTKMIETSRNNKTEKFDNNETSNLLVTHRVHQSYENKVEKEMKDSTGMLGINNKEFLQQIKEIPKTNEDLCNEIKNRKEHYVVEPNETEFRCEKTVNDCLENKQPDFKNAEGTSADVKTFLDETSNKIETRQNDMLDIIEHGFNMKTNAVRERDVSSSLSSQEDESDSCLTATIKSVLNAVSEVVSDCAKQPISNTGVVKEENLSNPSSILVEDIAKELTIITNKNHEDEMLSNGEVSPSIINFHDTFDWVIQSSTMQTEYDANIPAGGEKITASENVNHEDQESLDSMTKHPDTRDYCLSERDEVVLDSESTVRDEKDTTDSIANNTAICGEVSTEREDTVTDYAEYVKYLVSPKKLKMDQSLPTENMSQVHLESMDSMKKSTVKIDQALLVEDKIVTATDKDSHVKQILTDSIRSNSITRDIVPIEGYHTCVTVSSCKQADDTVETFKTKKILENVNSDNKYSQIFPDMQSTKPQYTSTSSLDHEIIVEKVIEEIDSAELLEKTANVVYKDDSGVVLKGIDCGTCFVFPLSEEDNTNSNVILDTNRKSFVEVFQIVSSDVDSLQSTDDETELKVKLPIETYSKRRLKRKMDVCDISGILKRRRNSKGKEEIPEIKLVEKKYRKSKNIDMPKQSVTTISTLNYIKEYKRLLEYLSSLEFSFSVSYDKHHIDVHELLTEWPIIGPATNLEEKTEIDSLLFKDHTEEKYIFDPMTQTLVEEINAEYEDTDTTSSDIEETNFKVGFGEGSGRVNQNFEGGGAISKFSAATLSDVKQSQPFLQSEDYGYFQNDKVTNTYEDQLQKIKQYLTYIKLRDKVRSFFKKSTFQLTHEWSNEQKKTKVCGYEVDKSNFPFSLYMNSFMPSPTEAVVQVVQVGQLPVSAAAQNPVTCDPRVTQVSDASPSQCSVENSPHDGSQQSIKTEYTELTTADLSMPLVQEFDQHTQPNDPEPQQTQLASDENTTVPTELVKSELKIEIVDETPEENTDENNPQNDQELKSLENQPANNMDYQFEPSETNILVQSNNNVDDLLFSSSENNNISDTFSIQKQQNGTSDKPDQLAHAMNAAGITSVSETVTSTRAQTLVNIMSQKTRAANTTQNSANTYSKATSINAMALQQALAQILPPPLNQTSAPENNHQGQNNQLSPQVLHIVQGKNNSGNQITLVENAQQSVISGPNATPVLHIVQNKGSVAGSASNGTPSSQTNTFGGLSLVDAGLQQGGNQLLHIVNTGNQKNGNPQLLKRVNLLTNLTNVQGSNEQKMVQFVCKSADGKAIQLNPHQRSMVLRLQPIETPAVQPATPKPHENQDLTPPPSSTNSALIKDSGTSQQEIKSRSVYEENYAKFIQNSSNKPTIPEKSTSLPKFNQAFGKQVFQDNNQKQNDINTNTSQIPTVNSNSETNDCSATDNAMNMDHIGQINSPPLLIRKSPAQTSQAQTNLVQQIKQTIGPMNIQTMHGGVIYTRQIPVNIGGGQTINLITVPSTELIDDSSQKQSGDVKFVNQGDIEPSIIKIVPQNQPPPNAEVSPEDGNLTVTGENAQNSQPQQVLTQMRIKLPMLSKAPQMVSGARVVRPSFFQIQRNVIGGANQPVYQQLVLTAAPPLGQHIRLPQTQSRPMKVSDNQTSESQMSSSTLEQLREFDMVLEQVKERSTGQPNSTSNSSFKLQTTSTDTTDSQASASSSSTTAETTQQVLYSIGSAQPLNVAYVNRKTTVATPTTSTFVRSPDSSGIADSPTSTTQVQLPHTVTSEASSSASESSQQKPMKISSKSKSRPKATAHHPPSSMKLNTIPPKTSAQKPLEDEQTTQRILYILAEYKEQVENSPDKDKPAPRRRSNPPSNPSGSSKRKKSSSGSRRPGARDMSPVHDDSCRTMGSEDSSCGTSQGDCNESCMESHSPQDSPRKIVRKLTFDQEPAIAQPRPQPQRNVIVADGQTITVARGTAGKPATAVLMPANYILPVSMVKGGQQIAIVTNRGPKLLTVGGGEGGATNALLLQRLIGPAGLKPVLTRPGVRHVRLPTSALHNLQAFNLTPAATVQPPDSTASPAPEPTPPELVETRAEASPWADPETETAKPDRTSSPDESEPWNLPSSADAHDYTYEESARPDNLDRTVLDPIPDRYSPDMEAQRIFDKMFDVESKKSYIVDSQDESPSCAYDIDASDDDKVYHQVVQKKDGTSQRQHRLAHVSAAALRHKYAILEHELRLQKSLSEECEDLGVDSPSASELFPEAELLFAASPAHDHTHHAHTPQPTILNQTGIQADIDDQIATDQLLNRDIPSRQELDVNLGLEDVGIVTVSEDGMQATIALDQEEFARSHPNTTFHSEPTDDGEVQPFTISGIKARHITSTIFHSTRGPATVLMATPQTTVISQAAPEASVQGAVKYSDIDNMIDSLPDPPNNINLNSVLVKDDRLTRFDSILTDSRELHLSNTASAIVHSQGNATQVIRRVCYDEDKRDSRFLMDEPDALIAGDDAKMIAEDSSRDATLESMADVDDDNSSPERHAELFWESNSASERSESRRPLDFSSDSEKCCKSPSYDETNSTDSSGVGTHMRLDSVIKEARGIERSGSADGSSADDTHPPLRTYPPKRLYHTMENEMERSLSGKTRAGERSPDSLEVRRRASGRGVVKRGCHCCNGSPAPSRPKKPRQRKPTIDFTN